MLELLKWVLFPKNGVDLANMLWIQIFQGLNMDKL